MRPLCFDVQFDEYVLASIEALAQLLASFGAVICTTYHSAANHEGVGVDLALETRYERCKVATLDAMRGGEVRRCAMVCNGVRWYALGCCAARCDGMRFSMRCEGTRCDATQ